MNDVHVVRCCELIVCGFCRGFGRGGRLHGFEGQVLGARGRPVANFRARFKRATDGA
jgi:hypothetical protein